MRRWSLLVAILAIATISLSASEPPVFIYVDADAAPGGNGSVLLPFNNLTDAVAMARAVSGLVTVKVAPGDYALTDTLVIDRSIDLRGSTELIVDADSWPTGGVVSNTATRVFSPNAGLTKLIAVDHGDGSVLRSVSIRGFLFEGTAAGTTVLLNRVQGYWIADNVFTGPAMSGLQSNASSGHVSGNYFSGVGTGAILAGGDSESRSVVLFDGNRAVNNSTGGVVLGGASLGSLEFGDELNVIVRDNDLSNNTGNQGFGLRAFILRRDANILGNAQSSANVYAEITGNRFAGNRVGVFIDAGFPYRRVDGGCDNRVYSGTMNLRFLRNTLFGNSLTGSLITFTRSAAALNPAILQQAQYLHGASFMISDRDGSLADAWIDHPATDPVIGPCPGDVSHELLGNLLVYNGQVQPNGRNY